MRVMYISKTHEKKAHSEPMDAYKIDSHEYHLQEHRREREDLKELILPEHMDRVVADVVEIMEKKPETWQKYENLPNGLWEVIRMENREVEKAYLAMKQGEGTHKDFTKELLHLATAILIAYKKMTCEK